MKHSVIAVLCVFLTLLGQAHDHSHEGHDHSHESHDHSHEDHDHSHDHKHVDAPTRQSKIDALESESIHKRWILRIIY
jgi:ABC-type Zn2+ transport system substrate-binding protein/surface adhesin